LSNISKGHATHEHGEDGLRRHLTKVNTSDAGMMNGAVKRNAISNAAFTKGDEVV